MKSYLNDEERKKYEGEYPEPEKDPEPGDGPESPKSSLDFEVPERCSLIEQLRISIVSPKQLIGLSQLKTGRFVLYVFFMGMILTLMLYVIPVAATLIHVGGLNDLFENRIPDFSVQQSVLKAEKPFTINLGTYEIVVDTESAEVDKEKLGNRELTFAIGSRKVQAVLTQNGLKQVLVEGRIDEFFPEGFDRKMLIRAIPGFYMALILGGLFMLVFHLAKYLLASLLYMLIANSIAKRTGLGLNTGNVFRLCFYAQTIGILLVNVNSATGGYLPGTIVSMVGIFITLHFIFKTFAPYSRYSTDE